MRRPVAALCALAALAGCGSSKPKTEPAPPSPTPQASALVACPRAVRNAVAEAAHASSSSWYVSDATLNDTTCVLVGGASGRETRVKVTIDTQPSAFRRFSDAEEETWQNTAGWKDFPARKPRPVNGVGNGAYWVLADKRLEVADDKTLATVVVLKGAPARAVAIRVARAALLPPSLEVPKEHDGE
jgi:hypothetical protein